MKSQWMKYMHDVQYIISCNGMGPLVTLKIRLFVSELLAYPFCTSINKEDVLTSSRSL